MRSPLIPLALLLLLPFISRAAESDPAFHFEADVAIPMRDGTRLSANIFRPAGPGPWPVILARTPYGKQDENWPGAKSYASKGYVMVVQDCRGRGKSGGVWEPFLNEANDGFDTQEWIGHQVWCNGRIGTSGGSYVGFTQWASAPRASRFLKTMVPMVPFGNPFEDVASSGGAMMLGLLMGWGEAVGGLPLNPEQIRNAYNHLPLQTYASQFSKEVPYLREWVQHPTYDAYWKARGIDHRYPDITVPILNVGGWYDIFSKATLDLSTGVRTHSRSARARTNQFVIIGPWGHGVGSRKLGQLDFGPEAELKVYSLQWDWYQHWLKDQDKGIHQWPPYQLFIMGENRWRGEQEWPIRRTRYTPFYLHSGGRANTLHGDGSLSTVAPVSTPLQSPSDHFVFDGNNPVPTTGGNNIVGATAGPEDQSNLELRDDILVYSTPPLEADIEVTGPVKLILWAASSARDTDFTGKLVDVHPDGRAFNLCEGIQRARYRHGASAVSFLKPGKPTRFEIDLWVTANQFKRGHRIRLEVSSSNYPRFDRNPNSGAPIGSDAELLPAKQTILHDSSHPSHLLLPVIPRE